MLCGNESAHKATGATLFGPDSSRWPAWWFDAVELFETYLRLERHAFEAASKTT